MARARVIYECQNCGFQSPKWLGRCPDCSQWNSLVEEAVTARPHARGDGDAGPARAPSPIHAVTTDTDSRMRSGIEEFDRVLGGGLVDGSAVLIGGDPGIGKSTLLLQAVAALSHDGPPCLYVSGEESEQQVKMRGQRISLASSNLLVLSETSLERILEQVRAVKPAVLVVDSIQTVHTSAIPSAPGSIGQVRECASALISLAKKSGIGTFLVGHVTKDGAIAGPRILEHMVDTVLYFEGERGHSFRILRAVKNRFGSTNEIGVFEMQEAGLREVSNPSQIFLSERPLGGSGSVVVPSMEGTRPILVEIQTLVTRSFLTLPRRTCIGVESNRVALILAILEKRKGMNFCPRATRQGRFHQCGRRRQRIRAGRGPGYRGGGGLERAGPAGGPLHDLCRRGGTGGRDPHREPGRGAGGRGGQAGLPQVCPAPGQLQAASACHASRVGGRRITGPVLGDPLVGATGRSPLRDITANLT